MLQRDAGSRQIITSQWFAFTELLLVVVSGAAWMVIPKFGIWFTLLVLLTWVWRLLAGHVPFKRTPFDWLIAAFLITAWVGYGAAYDKTTAWVKVWFIVTAVLLYFALSAQPKQNLRRTSMISFCIGFGISIYFFLTHDFTGGPGGIALWWMNNRPPNESPPISSDYVSGLLVITNLFAFYGLWSLRKKSLGRFSIVLKTFLILGTGTVLWVFFLTMARGILAAGACALGIWILWRVATSNRFTGRLRISSLFPVLVLAYLGAIIIFVYLGPARAGGDLPQNDYGKNTRAELLERGAYFLLDYPITGGGLNSFPGLYSQYMISIPSFYFIDSYNVFLDVAIEQGLIGGLTIVLIYFGSLWFVSRAIVIAHSHQTRFFNWLSLFALVVAIVHGLFYDYLYQGNGTMLLFLPIGFSMIGVRSLNSSEVKTIQSPQILTVLNRRNLPMIIIPVMSIIAVLAMNINKIISLWYSNLGAVQMSQVELKYFPTDTWATAEIVPELETADASFRSALQYDPKNQTANYRLGMISMLRRDFEAASVNLEKALQEAPNHRGIIKSLGYCYAWLGEMDKAQLLLLERIPEAQKEFSAYAWWWDTQGRRDLSINAFQMASLLNTQTSQP